MGKERAEFQKEATAFTQHHRNQGTRHCLVCGTALSWRRPKSERESKVGAVEEGGARLDGGSCLFTGRHRSSASQSKFEMIELFRDISA